MASVKLFHTHFIPDFETHPLIKKHFKVTSLLTLQITLIQTYKRPIKLYIYMFIYSLGPKA